MPLPSPSTKIRDRAYVELTNPNERPLAAVQADILGGTIPVLGSQAVLKGATVCRWGTTSKFACGTLIDVNREFVIDFGARRGLATVTGTNTMTGCGLPGDSGGPVITTAGQAQGTIVAALCQGSSAGFFTVYQPINQSPLDLQVRLVRPSGPPTTPPPVITAFFCYADELYGGTDPDTVQVSSNGSQAQRYNDYDQNHVFDSGRCDPYQDTHVSISVHDSAGRRADATQSGFCPRN